MLFLWYKSLLIKLASPLLNLYKVLYIFGFTLNIPEDKKIGR